MKHLFDLIQSMSKSEKRYFKLESKYDKGLKYVDLFNVFESLDNYDTSLIVSQLKLEHHDYNFLSDDVNYLYFKILGILNNFNKTRNADNIIKEYLGYIQTLSDKGLLGSALKVIKKTKKLIVQFERVNYLHEVIGLEHGVIVNLFDHKRIIKEKSSNIELVELFDEIKAVSNDYWSCILLSKKWPNNRKEYEAYLKKYDIKTINSSRGYLFKIKAYQIHQLYYFLEGNKLTEMKFLQDELRVINDEFPKFKKEYVDDYIKLFSRKLYLELAINPSNVLSTVQTFYKMPIKLKSYSLMNVSFVEVFTFNFVLEYYIRGDFFSAAVTFIEKQNLDIERFRNLVNDSLLISALYKIAYCYYRCKTYSLALDFANKIDSLFKEDTRVEVFHFNKLFLLFIHLSLKNYRLIENMVQYNKRFFLKNYNLFPVSVFLNEMFFTIVIYYKTSFNETLQLYHSKFINDKSLNLVNKYFDLENWFLEQEGGAPQTKEPLESPLFFDFS